LPHDSAGPVLVRPKIRLGGLLFQVDDFLFFTGDVKDAPGLP
jgi:hypothetical protein